MVAPKQPSRPPPAAPDAVDRGHAIFKTTLHVGELAVPVKLYSAVEDRRMRLRLLHAEDLQPVVQQLVNPRTGEPVPAHDVRKGYEVEPGRFVLLDPDVLAELEPRSDRRMNVLQVVPRAVLPVECVGRPYWLGPDGSHDEHAALACALAADDRAAIVSFTMRKRRYHGAVFGERGQLGLVTLLDPRTRVLPATRPTAAPARPLDPRQLALAEQLVTIMRAPFDPASHHDEHRARVHELVERKKAGEAIPAALPPPPAATVDLLRALEESLRRAREPHVA